MSVFLDGVEYELTLDELNGGPVYDPVVSSTTVNDIRIDAQGLSRVVSTRIIKGRVSMQIRERGVSAYLFHNGVLF